MKGIENMEKEQELLKPKIDVVFHSLFRKGNERITKALITSIINEKIEKVELDKDRYVVGEYPEEKLGIVDMKAELDNGTICDIEIQLSDNKDTAERFLYYWSRIYSGQLVKGKKYRNLNKVIGIIIIIDYNFEKTKEIERMSTKWKIKEVTTGKEIELTDMLELYIIEISKVKRALEKNPEDKLAQWIQFLDNPNEKGVLKKVMEKNKEIKEAMEDLERLSKIKKLRRIAELKEKAIRDEENGLRHAKEEGINIGLEKGKKLGLEEGRAIGEKSKQIEIARNLLQEGMSIEKVSTIVGLTKEEIEKIEK